MGVDVAPAELDARLAHVRQAPRDMGSLVLIVRRPDVDEREVVEEAELDLVEGLVGDSWHRRANPRTPDGAPDPLGQLNIMGSRAAALIAGDVERWPLAGDQLYVDLDLSEAALPAGTRLAIGEAVVEITDKPHRGCAKFSARFGPDALGLVNSPVGVELNLRGRNARVIVPGRIHAGDAIRRDRG